jgi:hypothetical protein
VKRAFFAGALTAAILLTPAPARADLFGGDVAVLTQILAQAIMQLARLREIVGTAQSQFDLLREINRGINDALNLMKTVDPNTDPGIYRDWATVQDALGKLQSIYGDVAQSPEARVQKDMDQAVAEAVTFNNSYYKYTKNLDEIGELIKSQSRVASPGGAQKLTAQAMGLMIQVMNQNLRAQATDLKLKAQGLAVQNKKDKDSTKYLLQTSQDLSKTMKNEKVSFAIPRF